MSTNELPQWKCHKLVRAAKIIDFTRSMPDVTVVLDGSFASGTAATESLPLSRFGKFKPTDGYFVLYDDGYKSFSPADTFEAGYMRIEPTTFQQRVKDEAAELGGRIFKLKMFMTGDIYARLDSGEQSRMYAQLGYMEGYQAILNARIEAFELA